MSSPDRRAKISAAAPRRRGPNRRGRGHRRGRPRHRGRRHRRGGRRPAQLRREHRGRLVAAHGRGRHGPGHRRQPGRPQGAPVLDLYEDFQCPVCKRFEALFGEQLTTLADEGKVKLVVHPLSFLDDNLGNDSSNRAANAAACAADQGKYLEFHAATFAGQPVREGDGYTDADLKGFAQTAGLTGAALDTWQKCYDDRAHNQWVESVQTQSEKDEVNGTPTVRLDGKDLDLGTLTPESLNAAVQAASQ